jgi:hypothetical protein
MGVDFISQGVVKISLIPVKPVMIKRRNSGLAEQKGVRLGPRGGSTFIVILAWICQPMSELNPYLFPFSPFT